MQPERQLSVMVIFLRLLTVLVEWVGGLLKAASKPYTITHTQDWSIQREGTLGYGRMRYLITSRKESTGDFLDQKLTRSCI